MARVVIFLDIDGVLNEFFPKGIPNENDVKNFDKQAIANLMSLIDRIQQQTHKKVEIILSSSWKEVGDIEQLRLLFRTQPFVHYLTGRTPGLVPRYRPAEILSWLRQNQVDDFIIFDDYPIGMNLFGERYIQVNPDNLLTQESTQRALEVIVSDNVFSVNEYNLDLNQYKVYKQEDCSMM